MSSPPRGKKRISLEIYDRLQALAAAIFDFGFASDLVHLGLSDPSVSILGSGRLACVSDDFERAKSAFLPKFTASEVIQATQHFDRYWPGAAKPVSGSPDPLQVEIEGASISEFGGPALSDLLSVMWAAAVLRLRPDQPFVLFDEDDLVSELAGGLQWDKARVSACLRILTLEPRADFLHPQSPYSSQDVFPWIFNRHLSYLSRPFLAREVSGERQIVYGLRHVEVASRTLLSVVFSGRYRAQTAPMRKLTGKIARRAGETFNNRVAEVLERDARLVVKRKLKKVGKLRLPGDIDVLTASPKRRRLYLIECKDLAACRTPHEFANQIDDLFDVGQGFLKRHLDRENWIKGHIDDLLTFLNLPRGKWKVESLIVLSEPLIVSHMRISPIRIITFDDLTNFAWS